MLLGLCILITLALFTGAYALLVMRRDTSRVSKRLDDIRHGTPGVDAVPEPVAMRLPLAGQIVARFGYLLPGQWRSDVVRWELAQAGYRALDAPKVFAGARLLLTLAFGFGSLAL